MRNRRKRRKRKQWPAFLGFFLAVCILSGMGTVVLKQFPQIFTSAKEAVETVKLQAGHEESVPFEKIKVPEVDMAGGYYYQQLGEEEQKLYTEIYQGILESSDSIYVHSSNVEALKKVSSFIFCDRPELFWCGGEMQMTSYADYSEIQPVYLYTGEEKEQRQSRIDTAVSECLSGITGDMTEYDKIKYIFEYLVNTVDYNLEAPDNQNIYSALVGKSSAAAGDRMHLRNRNHSGAGGTCVEYREMRRTVLSDGCYLWRSCVP